MPFELPALPYDHAALEPHIDARTMEIHHGKHHQAYVDNANKALDGTEWADRSVEDVLTELEVMPEEIRTAVRNNAGGHANHSLFWTIMSPDGGGEPEGALARRDRRRLRRPRQAEGGSQRRRREALRQRLVVARLGRHRPRRLLDPEPGQPDHDRRHAAPRHRRVGARLLPPVPEPAPRLPRRLVERRQLGGGCAAIRGGSRVTGSTPPSRDRPRGSVPAFHRGATSACAAGQTPRGLFLLASRRRCRPAELDCAGRRADDRDRRVVEPAGPDQRRSWTPRTPSGVQAAGAGPFTAPGRGNGAGLARAARGGGARARRGRTSPAGGSRAGLHPSVRADASRGPTR